MNAAVTGGSGFFGSALVRALRERGDAVRALVRRPEAAADMRALGAEPVMGDLTRPGGCDGLVAAGDAIFHAAARVELTGPWREFQRTTIDGTQRLLEAALPRRPRRFVYISSGSVYGPGGDRRGLCADRSPTRPSSYNFYGRAKLAAERLVRTECARVGCPWTIVRLGFLFGAGNRALLQHFIPMAQRRKLFVIGAGENRIATLYIDDAVRATVLAGTHPAAANQIYDVASDEPVTQRAFFDATTDALGLPRTRRRIGRRLAFAGAWLVEQLSGWAGRSPRISRTLVALMSTDQVMDAGRIRAELGWRPEVRFAEGIRRTQEWHRRLRWEGSVGRGEKPPAPASRVSA